MKRMFPIEWHQETLENFNETLRYKKRELERLQEEIKRMESEAAFRSLQISEAIKQGKTEYDRDRFLKSRKPCCE